MTVLIVVSGLFYFLLAGFLTVRQVKESTLVQTDRMMQFFWFMFGWAVIPFEALTWVGLKIDSLFSGKKDEDLDPLREGHHAIMAIVMVLGAALTSQLPKEPPQVCHCEPVKSISVSK